MKIILSASLIVLCMAFQPAMIRAGEGSSDQTSWLVNFEEAKTYATSKGRPILINFSGSDWCLPCMRLERDLFSTPEFESFSKDNLVLLKLDFPARKKNELSPEQLKHNEALAEIYNDKGAFPLVIITDEAGKVMGTMDHPKSSAEAYINSIREIISK